MRAMDRLTLNARRQPPRHAILDADSNFTSAPTSSHPQDISENATISTPYTLAGQKPRAILRVRRTPTLGNYEDAPEVGDFVLVKRHYNHSCDILNLRSGIEQTVPWEIFFQLTVGEKCCCPGGVCRCDVEDADRFFVS